MMKMSSSIKKNRLCIGFPTVSKIEGPKIFLSRLKNCFEKEGIAKTTHFLNPICDVALFTSYARFCYGRSYVLRLDGIAIDNQNTIVNSIKINHKIFKSINRAGAIVYQSNFTKMLIEHFFDYQKEHFAVIINGVDLEEFTASGSNFRSEINLQKNDIVLITSAAWRKHKRLKDVLKVFYEIEKESPVDFHLIILGNSDIPIPVHPRIHYPGVVAVNELAKWYRTGDIFIYLSWLDNCPNSVIEAQACGLPVICSNQGGTHEILKTTKGGIVVNADKAYDYSMVDLYNPPEPDHLKIMAAVLKVAENLNQYKERIDRSAIDIRWVAKKYFDVINHVYS